MRRNRRSSSFVWIVLVSVLGLSLVDRSYAAPQGFSFSGTISSLTDPGGLLDPAIQLGSAFTGSYSIDPDLADTPVVLANGTAYRDASGASLGQLSASIAGALVESDVTVVFVGDDRFQSGFGVVDAWTSGVNLPVAPGGIVEITIAFLDESATKLSSEALFINQETAGWTTAFIRISEYGSSGLIQSLAEGQIDLAPLPAVPTGDIEAKLILILAMTCLAGWAIRRVSPAIQ